MRDCQSRILCLSAGGCKGILSASILEYINRVQPYRTDYSETMGVSVGSIIAWVVAQTNSVDDLKKQVNKCLTKLENHHTFLQKWTVLGSAINLFLSLLSHEHLYRKESLHNMLETFKLNSSTLCKKLTVGIFCNDTGKYTEVDCETHSRNKIMKYIKASSSIQIFFAPTEIDGQKYSDGAIKHCIPINEITKIVEHRSMSSHIDAIFCTPTTFDNFMGAIKDPCGTHLLKSVNNFAADVLWLVTENDIEELHRLYPITRLRRDGYEILQGGTNNQHTITMISPINVKYSGLEPSTCEIKNLRELGQHTGSNIHCICNKQSEQSFTVEKLLCDICKKPTENGCQICFQATCSECTALQCFKESTK